MSIFKLPDLGEGLPDAEINEWYVKEGDEVKVDQPIVSMETAKAVVDVPSPQTGRIAKLYGKPGDIIKTGAPLVEFVSENKTTPTAKVSNDTGTVVGNIVVGEKHVVETAIIGSAGGAKSTVKATPAVRALAQRLQVDLNQITPSGPNGSITLDDVQNASTSSSVSPLQQARSSEGDQFSFEPLRGVRRTMASSMAKSHAEVAAVTIVDDADIHAWPTGADITVRVIQALIAACKAEPALNAWYDAQQNSRHLFKEVHLGLAMDTEEGLFVPVIKDAASLSAQALRDRINQFKESVKTRNIPPEDLRGFSITLSNFGNFAGRYANPVVVPPAVAILGTGKIRDEVVAVDGKAVVHRCIPLSLTFDHRAVMGGEAARFLKTVIRLLSNPASFT